MTAIEFTNQVQTLSYSLKPVALNLTRDLDDAKDLIQETLVKALQNKEKFKAGTNLKAWLYTIMRNSFINNYNKITKRSTTLDNTDQITFLNTDDRFVAQNNAVSSFALNDINQAIEHLNDEYRKPFMMYYTGYKYLEIAEHLQIPIGTVKNRIHIARKELKDKLRVYNPVV
ncbi:RNA polymerase sigma factor [Adhaeribacter aerolatus]|uniref:RNA polymerase sigma factor n=1 Tax=Adhaeribacter aerolatus TaxID=670289 RepID=A0A512AUV0_9BACT|nr:RNA polymerase sigma factor [Adhaeribacter aerolatus]GEO03491.1 RNA polymerase sigma factor [Adhaeribacter aerolatus]